jgi:hypothetical protein
MKGGEPRESGEIFPHRQQRRGSGRRRGGTIKERDTLDPSVRLIGAAGTRRPALRLVIAGAMLGGVGTLEGTAIKSRRTNRQRRNRGVRAEQAAVVP